MEPGSTRNAPGPAIGQSYTITDANATEPVVADSHRGTASSGRLASGLAARRVLPAARAEKVEGVPWCPNDDTICGHPGARWVSQGL